MKRILLLTLPALFLITELAAQFQVGHTTVTFTDPDRNNREILTEIYYPANAGGDDVEAADGQFPVIVFGHGFVMVWSAYENIWEHLVPQGYIMAFPRTEGNLFPNHQAFGLDLAFLTTEMEAFGADASSILFQHVAPESAVMGHSMGGGCSFLAAEAADVNAVVGLAPAETSTSAIAAAANVTAPTLVLSGAADGVTPPEDHHILIYNAAAAACKHLVSIEEGSHCYFANSNFNCDFGEFNPGDISREQQQQIMNDLLDPWLEQHLKGSCTAYAEFIAAVDAEPLTSLEGSCDASSLELDTPVVTITDCHPVLQTATAEVSIPWSGDAAPQWLVNGEAIVDDQSPLVVTLAELPAEGQSIDLALANGACEWTFPAAVTLPDGCEIIFGCTYTASTNYNPDANVDDGSCDLITGNPTCLGDLNIDGVVNSNDLPLVSVNLWYNLRVILSLLRVNRIRLYILPSKGWYEVFFGALSLALLLAACGTTETYKFTYEAEFVLEGPLFEGPNTGQETVNEALDAWLKENNLLKGQLSNVQLVMAEVSKDPALEAGLVTDAGLTFAADQLDMVTAATLNPFPTDASSGSMKVSEEAELTPFFEQESFILLLDLGLSEDLYDNYVAKANLEFEVTVIK